MARFRFDRDAILNAVTEPDGAVGVRLGEYGREVERGAKKALTEAGRVDTGKLRQSVGTLVYRTQARRLTVRVGSDVEYALHVHNGTGVFGEHGTPIVPRRAKVLRFPAKGSTASRTSRGGFVYAAQVRGIPATPYLTGPFETLKARLR